MAKNKYWIVVGGWYDGLYDRWDGGAREASERKSGELHQGYRSYEKALSDYKKLTGGKSPFYRTWNKVSPLDVKNLSVIKQFGISQAVECGLSDGSGKPPANHEIANNGLEINPEDIGRWGEEWALYKLLDKFGEKYPGDHQAVATTYGYRSDIDSNTILEFVWKNKTRESGESPDILVKENDLLSYWEVKSTINFHIGDFYITANEWEMAKGKGDQYNILRVMGAGTNNPQIVEINNPYQLWMRGRLNIKGLQPAFIDLPNSSTEVKQFNDTGDIAGQSQDTTTNRLLKWLRSQRKKIVGYFSRLMVIIKKSILKQQQSIE